MKKHSPHFILAGALFLAAISCHHAVRTATPELTNGATIEGIRVAGNHAVSTEAIRAKIQIKPGDRINAAAVNRDILNVRALGFNDVRVEEENGRNAGKIIIFSVKEEIPEDLPAVIHPKKRIPNPNP